jgi:hypothetical protein
MYHINQIDKEAKQMAKTLNIGDSYTTAQSKVTGTVQEIVKNANGSLRVRLSVNGADRWTTVK